MEQTKKIKSFLYSIKFLRSLRLRLFFIFLFAGLAASFTMRYALLKSYEDRAVKVRLADVQNQYNILAYHLYTSGYLYDTSLERINTELEQLSTLYDGRILIIDKAFKVVKDTYGISEGRTVISQEVIESSLGTSTNNYEKQNGFLELAIPIAPFSSSMAGGNVQGTESGEDGTRAVEGVLLASASTFSITNTLNALRRTGYIIQGLFMLFMVPVAIVLAGALTAPFSRITKSITQIKAGFTDEKIDVHDYLETEHISDAFNQLQGRMKVLDDSRQEFVSNVSHELKTPITSIKVLADSLIARENVPNELYREFMADIGEEIDRESKIIDDLLTMVKMDKRSWDVNFAVTDINSLLELILKRMRPIAAKAEVDIIMESIRPVTAEVDEVKLTLAISNLVENGIKYNKPGGRVHVRLDADHQNFEIGIMDNGPGIPEDAIEHIYERFYRVDKSHSRTVGGTGLGLAITKSAVLMHRGTIDVESKVGEGTTFTVKIPLTRTGTQ